MRLIKTKLISGSVMSAVAVAGLAIGSGVVASTPSHAKGVDQNTSVALPAAKARASGVQLAACSPCKAKACNPCNPCKPCAAKNPCNPCGAKKK